VANVVGGVVVLVVSVVVPLVVARAALSLMIALMTFREEQRDAPAGLEFRRAETPEAGPASAQ
jgi:hypothetical protein